MGLLQRILQWILGGAATRPRAADLVVRESQASAKEEATPRAPLQPATAPAPEASSDPYFSAPAAPEAAKPKRAKTLGLEASEFLPITRAELNVAAQGKDLFGNPW